MSACAREGEGAFLGVECSVGGRRWRLRAHDDRVALALAQSLGTHELIGRILAGRGVGTQDCSRYFNPTLRDWLPDPSSFAEMDQAADRIASAVRRGETVAVFGDYDVDGATSAALLLRFLRALGVSPRLYVPDRMTEGYGPNTAALLRLKEEGAALVVTVDCGTLAHEPLSVAAQAGLDVIVVDHHQPGPNLPGAAALVNPNRLDDGSGCGALAAVGIAFLLCVAVNRALRQAGWFQSGRKEPELLQDLDLVALGTVCDVVPLVGLNRVFVTQGLKVLAARRNIGLAALADIARLECAPGAYHLGFVLGPRVNAGGRVGRSDLGARLLASDDAVEASRIGLALDRLNAERQAIESLVLEQALAEAEREARTSAPVLVVAGRGWHPGVVGIVASRLVERYGRPVFVIGLDGDIGKGSGRSVPGTDLGAAVLAARQAGLISAGGGHAMAAGLTVEAHRIPALREFLTGRLLPSSGGGRQDLLLDGALAPAGATLDLAELIARAGPFGAGNPAPRFALPSVRVFEPTPVGNGHVRCVLAGEGRSSVRAIAFRARDTALGGALLTQRRDLHVVGCLEAETWRGRTRITWKIEDAAPASPTVLAPAGPRNDRVAPLSSFGL